MKHRAPGPSLLTQESEPAAGGCLLSACSWCLFLGKVLKAVCPAGNCGRPPDREKRFPAQRRPRASLWDGDHGSHRSAHSQDATSRSTWDSAALNNQTQAQGLSLPAASLDGWGWAATSSATEVSGLHSPFSRLLKTQIHTAKGTLHKGEVCAALFAKRAWGF